MSGARLDWLAGDGALATPIAAVSGTDGNTRSFARHVV